MIEQILSYLQTNSFKLTHECFKSEVRAKQKLWSNKIKTENQFIQSVDFFLDNSHEVIMEQFQKIEDSFLNLKTAGQGLFKLTKEIAKKYQIAQTYEDKLSDFSQYFRNPNEIGTPLIFESYSEQEKLSYINDSQIRRGNFEKHFNFVKHLADNSQDKPQFIQTIIDLDFLKTHQKTEFSLPYLRIISVLSSNTLGVDYLKQKGLVERISELLDIKFKQDSLEYKYFLTIIKKLSLDEQFAVTFREQTGPFLQYLQHNNNQDPFVHRYLSQILYQFSLNQDQVQSLYNLLKKENIDQNCKKILVVKIWENKQEEDEKWTEFLQENEWVNNFVENDVEGVKQKLSQKSLVFESFKGDTY